VVFGILKIVRSFGGVIFKNSLSILYPRTNLLNTFQMIFTAPKTPSTSPTAPPTTDNYRLNETDGWNEDEDEEEDDHMESSRVLSPGTRFQPSLSSTRTSSIFGAAPISSYGSTGAMASNGGGYRGRPSVLSSAPQGMVNGASLGEKLKGAWGFFSRPNGQATPCSEGVFNIGANRQSKYAARQPMSLVSAVIRRSRQGLVSS